jgi:RNA polymerase-binding transcription factor DksA
MKRALVTTENESQVDEARGNNYNKPNDAIKKANKALKTLQDTKYGVCKRSVQKRSEICGSWS